MANPNRVLANSRRVMQKLECVGCSSQSKADEIAASKRAEGLIVKTSRFRIGSRNDRLYSYQVHVYRPTK